MCPTTRGAEGSGGVRIQAVARAARLLMLVATDATDGSGKALAQSAGLATPTAHHLLSTLVQERLLCRDERARFALGPAAVVLADAVQREPRAPACLRRPLDLLVGRTGETGQLVALRDGAPRAIATLEGWEAGCVWTAGSPSGEPTGAAAARALGPSTRERGYALDEEELQAGVCGIAAPLLVEGVAVAALSLLVPAARFRRRREELVDTLLDVAGGRGGRRACA